jgi:hypothetical protein
MNYPAFVGFVQDCSDRGIAGSSYFAGKHPFGFGFQSNSTTAFTKRVERMYSMDLTVKWSITTLVTPTQVTTTVLTSYDLELVAELDFIRTDRQGARVRSVDCTLRIYWCMTYVRYHFKTR